MDIVEQLRNNADEKLAVWQIVTIMNKAADEIERLRKDVEVANSIIDGMTARFVQAQNSIEEKIKLRNALEKYDCLHKCTEPCALYHLEKEKEGSMPHMICGWWASEALMEKK